MRPMSAFAFPVGAAVPMYVAPEEVAVGRSVFQHFVLDELLHEGLAESIHEAGDIPDQNEFASDTVEEDRLLQPWESSEEMENTPHGYKNVTVRRVGSSIRELANDFARSQQRVEIKREADQVDLGSINRDMFWDLLEEVFRDGITSHALIALFFFCRDILIRCIQKKLRNLGWSLFRWSMDYVAERVCAWVHKHGGWESIYRHAWSQPFAFAAFGVLVGAFVFTMLRS